jgi:hypothetical protein
VTVTATKSLSDVASSLLRGIARHRERYIRAWVAATGLRPDECRLVERVDIEDGKIRTVIHVEPNPEQRRCERCAGWIESARLGEKRLCVVLPNEQTLETKVGQPCFYTAADFGCSLFEAKEKS